LAWRASPDTPSSKELAAGLPRGFMTEAFRSVTSQTWKGWESGLEEYETEPFEDGRMLAHKLMVSASI